MSSIAIVRYSVATVRNSSFMIYLIVNWDKAEALFGRMQLERYQKFKNRVN